MTPPYEVGVLAADAGIADVNGPGAGGVLKRQGSSAATHVPAYLRDVYEWAYLDPAKARLLDRNAVVSAILWGNNRRLQRALTDELSPGGRVLQAAHVYGDLIPIMAAKIGAGGRLDVVDVVPLQAALCRRKLLNYPQAHVYVADAGTFAGEGYDVASCFFLLHELPDDIKRAVVDNVLACLGSGGRAVFIDYHRPALWHPLRPVMRMIYSWFEPFAESLWQNDIRAFAADPGGYTWEKQIFFGGLYQKTVVSRRPDP